MSLRDYKEAELLNELERRQLSLTGAKLDLGGNFSVDNVGDTLRFNFHSDSWVISEANLRRLSMLVSAVRHNSSAPDDVTRKR